MTELGFCTNEEAANALLMNEKRERLQRMFAGSRFKAADLSDDNVNEFAPVADAYLRATDLCQTYAYKRASEKARELEDEFGNTTDEDKLAIQRAKADAIAHWKKTHKKQVDQLREKMRGVHIRLIELGL